MTQSTVTIHLPALLGTIGWLTVGDEIAAIHLLDALGAQGVAPYGAEWLQRVRRHLIRVFEREVTGC